MLVSFLYLIFALLGLGFLIFIHELGHYFMARRVGMRVESFGIGFGKPIYSFERKGVKWNICWLPFGGYVKIAGMEKEGNIEPQDIPDGFFGKSPIARIQVAIMGPLANLAFALILFVILFATGGREKPYAELTTKVGWVDPSSEMYALGVRPGDEIKAYDGSQLRGSKDHMQAAMMAGDIVQVEGSHYDEATGTFSPFSLTVHPYTHPLALERGILTTGILAPASYLIYDKLPGGIDNPLPENSPLAKSGIEYGDRIVWVDGERIYSLDQLSFLLNDERSLLTIERNSTKILRRVPRVSIEEFKLEASQKEELTDWQWEAKLKENKFQKLLFIPYNLTADGRVESRLQFIDARREKDYFPKNPLSSVEEPLLPGDVILAIDGIPVTSSYEIMSLLQKKQVQVVVERKPNTHALLSWNVADKAFDKEFSLTDLQKIEDSIGDVTPITSSGNLVLLQPVVPCTRKELLDQKDTQFVAQELSDERKHIEAIDDPQKRQQALKFLEMRQKQLLLGLPGVQDKRVVYNPNPLVLFKDIVCEIASTLTALIGGYLNPKWLTGPIGIVQVIHHNWMLGLKEAVFWIATISLNLGLLNLLPLPVLDGGYICLSLFELITGRRLRTKTIEKIVVPFAILLVSLLIFLTYNDILRLISRFFQ